MSGAEHPGRAASLSACQAQRCACRQAATTLATKTTQAVLQMENGLVIGVELRGLEPLTPTLPVWCATSCATAPWPARCLQRADGNDTGRGRATGGGVERRAEALAKQIGRAQSRERG